MPTDFTVSNRSIPKRRRVKHKKPTTIREKLIAGLEVLGFEPHQSSQASSRYSIYSRGGKRKWYVGDSGALRIGNNITESYKASDVTKEFVLTAPTVKPIVEGALEGIEDLPGKGDEDELAEKLKIQHEALTNISVKVVCAHIRRVVAQRGAHASETERE